MKTFEKQKSDFRQITSGRDEWTRIKRQRQSSGGSLLTGPRAQTDPHLMPSAIFDTR